MSISFQFELSGTFSIHAERVCDILPSIPLDRPTYQAWIRHAAAYLTVESCGIFAIASAMCFTPSGPILLLAILQAMQVAVGQIRMRDSAQYHTVTHPSKLRAHLREHRLGISLIAAMSAFSPSMFPL